MKKETFVPNNNPRLPSRPEGNHDTPGGGEMLTKQAFKNDVDVNRIVDLYGSTGQWTNVAPRQPTYGDVSYAMDLVDAQNLMNHAVGEFAKLPAKIREMADNDPIRFANMMADPAAVEALAAAGLPIVEPKKTDPEKTPGGDPAPS